MTSLTKALRMNPVIKELSVSHCGLTAESGRGIMEILIFQESELEEVNFRGNFLGNIGISHILFGLRINKAVNAINLSDNDVNDEIPLINDLVEMLKLNENLSKIDLRFSRIYDNGCKLLCEGFKTIKLINANSSIGEILLPESNIRASLLDELSNSLGSGAQKGKKGKKRKGKKKGKKK